METISRIGHIAAEKFNVNPADWLAGFELPEISVSSCFDDELVSIGAHRHPRDATPCIQVMPVDSEVRQFPGNQLAKHFMLVPILHHRPARCQQVFSIAGKGNAVKTVSLDPRQ